MRTRKNAHKKNAHKKNAHKRRTNKSVKRRKTRTLTRKRSYKYQRRGGVGPRRSAARAAAAAVPEAAAEMNVEIGKFYILAPDQGGFTPVYLTRELNIRDETEIMAQSLRPQNYPHKIYSAIDDSQTESMIKKNFIGEVKIDNMFDNGDSITFSNAKYIITLHKDLGDILNTIKSNYGLK